MKSECVLVLFGERKQNEPMKCFKPGVMGCTGIIENLDGIRDGLKSYSYTVYFENGDKKTVYNSLYVTMTDGEV